MMETHLNAVQLGLERVSITGQAGSKILCHKDSRTEICWRKARTEYGVVVGTGRVTDSTVLFGQTSLMRNSEILV